MFLQTIYRKIKDGVYKTRYSNLRPSYRIFSHLTIQERVMLYKLARGRENILEIGSYIGASACCFAAAIVERGEGKVLCVDTWENDAMTEGNRDTYDEFMDNTALFSRVIVTIRGRSTEVSDKAAEILPGLDLLFIDGDHSYESVKDDWDAYRRFLADGSVVIFHDWGWAEGVIRVIEEEVKPMVSRHGNLPNLWWGTMGSLS